MKNFGEGGDSAAAPSPTKNDEVNECCESCAWLSSDSESSGSTEKNEASRGYLGKFLWDFENKARRMNCRGVEEKEEEEEKEEAVQRVRASASLPKREFQVCEQQLARTKNGAAQQRTPAGKSPDENPSESEIDRFVRIIEGKFREESSGKMKGGFCTNDPLPAASSYYCLASLRPRAAAADSSSEIGPLIFGPFFLSPSDLSICGRGSDSGSHDRRGSQTAAACLCDSTGWIYKACEWMSVRQKKAAEEKDDADPSEREGAVNGGAVEREICKDCGEKEESGGNSPAKLPGYEKSLGCPRASRCELRVPVILSHHASYEGFSLGLKDMEDRLCARCHLKSDEVAKWGNCFQLVQSVLRGKDERAEEKCADVRLVGQEESVKSAAEGRIGLDESREVERAGQYPSGTRDFGSEDVCATMLLDSFDNLRRFQSIGSCAFAKLCRNLLKWTHCTSKNWRVLKGLPRLVVHLPSLGYSNDLRCRATATFHYLQNIQIGRIGWLDDPNVQLLYIFPSAQSEELEEMLRSLVSLVRPDVDATKRLWMVQPNVQCNAKKCMSGSENLFFSPETYRRVRHLTAGCRAFILPGIMNEMDVFVACELKIPIIGPPLKFQKKLLNKSHCMELLHENRIDHPPFLHVHNFQQLCKGLAAMTFKYPLYKKWLVKIDEGFSGYQSAAVCLDKGPLSKVIRNEKRTCDLTENRLSKLFADLLPSELKVNKGIYADCQEFFDDVKRHGAVIEACPPNNCDTVSVGVFIEHDVAKAMIVNAADVIRLEAEADVAIDVAYIFPQNRIPRERLLEVTKKVGLALRNEHIIGYFGFDVVVFSTAPEMCELWVVDVDPYYTDLIACTDWIKFSLGPRETLVERETRNLRNRGRTGAKEECDVELLLQQIDRHVVYSGKLYNDGLSEFRGGTFLSICTNNNILYDKEEKIGCIVYPTDHEKRAVSVISVNSSRAAAIQRFISTLNSLHEISIDGDFNKRIKTNMLDVAKQLEHGKYDKF